MKQIIMGIAFILFIAVTAVALKNVIQGDFTPAPYKVAVPSGSAPSGDAQVINVRMEDGYKYIMEPSTLEAGKPAKLVFDMNTVQGCMRSVVIPAFGVRKSLSTRDNVVEFTPDQTGEFKITCSMGMGKGSFTVNGGSEFQAVKADDSINALPGGGSCGSGGGGCGCGGGA